MFRIDLLLAMDLSKPVRRMEIRIEIQYEITLTVPVITDSDLDNFRVVNDYIFTCHFRT